MPSIETKNFGAVSYEPESIVEFPRGLPGFEERKGFIALRFSASEPLIFLQSLEDPALCFPTLPVLVVDPKYQLRVSQEDRELTGLAVGRPLVIGQDVLCLTVVSLRENGSSANLLAPLVVNLHNRKAVQAVAADSGYSHQHVLVPDEAAVCS